jgi:hypothetical protein
MITIRIYMSIGGKGAVLQNRRRTGALKKGKKKGRGVNHAQTTTRRMEESCLHAGAGSINQQPRKKIFPSLKSLFLSPSSKLLATHVPVGLLHSPCAGHSTL